MGKEGILSRNLPHGAFVFDSIPRSPMAYFSPALSFAVGPGKANEVEIDNVSVSAFYKVENEKRLLTLFSEDFRQLKKKNDWGSSGWRTKGELDIERYLDESALKALRIKADEREQVTVVKSFNIPVDFPFDISDNNFEIRYNEDMYEDTAAYDAYPRHGGNSASTNNFYSSSSTTFSNSIPGRSRTSELLNTYYIYTFDGKLLAEYDHNGNCVRDYIYAGNRLIAEYKPQTNEYFYYMTDQINSTRIITNDSGNVVFSEAYGPYGDVQKTWVNTYDPKLKFSGKEREGYSDLDYFGARYYSNRNYRFNSVDPVINKAGALLKPQMWNLYAYCDNNPITFVDPDGREPNKSQVTGPNRLIAYINSAPGNTASAKLAWLGTYSNAPGRFGGANPKNKRYIYTEKAGWIDLAHFFGVAAEIDKLSGIERIGAWMFGGFALWQKTKEIENNQAAKGLIGTAWSYEDAPSNYYGWLFWKFYYDPNGNLGDQMQRFLEDYGGTNPQNAPNWNQMWNKENPNKQQFPQNKSFNPKFTK